MDAPALDVDDVHVWWASCSAAPTAGQSLYDLLDAAERSRADRLRVGAARLRYLVARGLTRVLLARYSGLDPAALTFGAGARGKPRLENPPLPGPPMFFNAAHSGDTVVLALARSELGVDVEAARAMPNLERLAARYCSQGEQNRLARLPRDQQEAGFLRIWTAKEAYLKAVGSGVAMPLRKIEVELTPLRLARINNDPHAAAEWTLLGTDLPEPAMCTVAIRGRHARLDVCEFSWSI